MYDAKKPFISSETELPEITVKVIILSLILTILLAMSNAYLALKIGILASASIPAAIISMGVLRFFKKSNILENNLVQTAASAGEAVAGGIVYTAPALIIIHYWHHFAYWENFCIALLGGTLGVLFSIPLRRVLVTQEQLTFPEGQAIAQVLITGTQKSFGLREVVLGGVIGALIEFLQVGLQAIPHYFSLWFHAGKSVIGFGAGFSPTMIGVGYLVGFNVGFSMLIGAILGWFIGIPVLSFLDPSTLSVSDASQVAMSIWNEKVRYIGIGGMLLAGLWSLLSLIKPFLLSIVDAYKAFQQRHVKAFMDLPRTERDMPLNYVMMGVGLLLLIIYIFFFFSFPLAKLNLSAPMNHAILIGSVIYILVVGFIFCAITGYFSGLVGVTASPGSAIIIAGLLIAAIILRVIINQQFDDPAIFHNALSIVDSETAAAVITIFLGAIITSAAAIANDNIQDLKVGHIIGATPWKQQVMLLFGVLISAATIPFVMELLFNVYGIGDVLPHANMDIAQALPAPPAAMMAAITQGVFSYDLPWDMINTGAAIVVVAIIVNAILPHRYRLSVLGIAMGVYLPLTTSMPLFMGGLLSLLTKKNLQHQIDQQQLGEEDFKPRRQRGILMACGLVSGAALMNICLAIPFVIIGNPNALAIMPKSLEGVSQVLGIGITLALCWWIYRRVCYDRNNQE